MNAQRREHGPSTAARTAASLPHPSKASLFALDARRAAPRAGAQLSCVRVSGRDGAVRQAAKLSMQIVMPFRGIRKA